jgi:hypothetical protein
MLVLSTVTWVVGKLMKAFWEALWLLWEMMSVLQGLMWGV